MIRQSIIRAALLLFLGPLAISTASACRGKPYDEHEAPSTIKGISFPDYIEDLSRKSLRTNRCRWNGHDFSVFYGDEKSKWAQITILYRDPKVSFARHALDLAENAQRLAKLRNQIDTREQWTALSSNIDGITGLSFLIKTSDGNERKHFDFILQLNSKTVAIEYGTSVLPSASKEALEFRNSYLKHLTASSGMSLEPPAGIP